ncbi:uncharacterized protein C8Q71DRAFT_108631 [Rhodofomes roseus]|uniref:Uncharacterized protein n=1 Tax=Rhodofomes roseus TaxID=34475 RepID=A0ABQ8KD60_9APHY|nr:uncharacterized protein C8Q71DRAFT_108631 [Rhodofomes roseus]KAH9835202.1 hypothetical protein C8Q71DRAFT_108631 [Rhodofomes roseus]
MSASYYREQTHFYPSVHTTVSNNVVLPDDHTQADIVAQDSPPSHPAGPPRYCTVKGCTVILLSDYLHKMCEACRGRHRVYAMTKRAKRKMEKAALGSHGGQPVIWMPQDDAIEDEDDEGEAPQSSQSVEAEERAETAETFRFPPESWDHNAIDPTLFSQESALAGALTLPGSSNHSLRTRNIARQQEALADAALNSPYAPLADNPTSMNLQTGMQLPLASLSPAIFDRPSDGRDESAPPRICSIKGCKAHVPGNSFFKMCEPCRDRYRNYGITKRAKWKQEKEVAVAELQKVHGEEDDRPAEAGLSMSPLLKSTEPEWHEWQTDGTTRMQTPQSADGGAGPSAPRPARMCTVSHCREILPSDYHFLRCDRHRLQNRHHSKLKRVRDKEVKVAAFNHWMASVGHTNGSEPPPALVPDDGSDSEEEHGPSYDNEGTPGTGIPATGLPPAARGMRRTNHVCSIKVCFNLLAPTNPWRMCDACRARDRAHRREKALRDSGVITTPPPRAPRRSRTADGVDQEQAGGDGAAGDLPKKKKKKKKKKKAVEEAPAESQPGGSDPASTTVQQAPDVEVSGEPQAPGLVFMAPLLPPQSSSAAVTEQAPPSEIPADPTLPANSTPLAEVLPTTDVPPPASSHPMAEPIAAPFQIVSAEEIVSRTTQAEATAAAPKKKRKVHKSAASGMPSAPGHVNAEASSSTSGVPAAPLPPPPIQPAPPAAHEPLPFPPPPPFPIDAPPHGYPQYYAQPYGMQPYGAQPPPYPYSHYGPHYQYPPPPYAYQSPYPAYPQPYPYAPLPPYGQQPYGPPPYSVAGPPPPVPPPPQGTYSVSSDFVSRTDYAAASQSVHQQGGTSYGGPAGTAPHYATFSAKTGEPHNRVSSVPSVLRRKRPLEGEGMFYAGKQPAASASSSTEQGAAPPVPERPAASAAPESDPHPEVIASASNSGSGPIDDAMTQVVCGNQKCRRPLSATHHGGLCARCRERLKKRSEKAKHRFRLEPRRLVGKAGATADDRGSVESSEQHVHVTELGAALAA